MVRWYRELAKLETPTVCSLMPSRGSTFSPFVRPPQMRRHTFRAERRPRTKPVQRPGGGRALGGHSPGSNTAPDIIAENDFAMTVKSSAFPVTKTTWF